MALITVIPLLALSSAGATPQCAGLPVTISGTPGDDVIYGTPLRDVISAGRGADLIYGLGGDDVICGGRGPDEIHGGPGDDVIRGGNAADRILGNRGDDDLRGNVGQDTLIGGPGSDACEQYAVARRCEASAGQVDVTNCSHRTDAILVPECGAHLGTTSRDFDQLDLGSQEAALQRDVALVRRYKVGPNDDFFTPEEIGWSEGGRTLVVSWKITTINDRGPAWARVASGEFDEEIERVAHDIAESGQKVMFSLHHEPENDVGVFGTAADYVAMFRHVHALMEPIAGDRLVWFVNYRGWSTGVTSEVEALYPGDDVIDWISFNPYNWYGCSDGASWSSFATQARPFYDWASANHPDKPLMIGETATNEFAGNEGRKARWIGAMADALQRDFPRIRALIWFQQSPATGFCDRRWDTTLNSSVAFWIVGLNPYFGGEPASS